MPSFEITGQRTISAKELIERHGDPALNVHIQENRNEHVELISTTGKTYIVHLGLPETIGDPYVKQYMPPYEPHIFTADRFLLRSRSDPNQLLVDEADLTILYMHGRRSSNSWVPSSPTLEQAGVTIPDLLNAFEAVTGSLVDVVWVCQAAPNNPEHELHAHTGHPYIYPIAGYAQGTVSLERGHLEVTLDEALDDNSRVEYQDWLAARSKGDEVK